MTEWDCRVGGIRQLCVTASAGEVAGNRGLHGVRVSVSRCSTAKVVAAEKAGRKAYLQLNPSFYAGLAEALWDKAREKGYS